MEIVISKKVDCRWMYTPLAVVHLYFAFRELRAGEVVELLINNEESHADVLSWSRMTGNPVLRTREKDDYTVLFVQKNQLNGGSNGRYSNYRNTGL